MSLSNRAIKRAYENGYRSDDEGNIFGPTGTKLVLGNGSNGYLIFRIWKDVKHVTVSAHRFSAYCYFGDEVFNHQCVRHLNGIKTDNRKENLALGSLSDNYRDIPVKWRIDFSLKGAKTKRKLTPSNVQEIRLEIESGKPLKSIAVKYGVARSTIQQIKEGKSYAWVK